MNLPTTLSSPNSQLVIGKSEPMQKVWHQVEQVAPTNSTVLITGETGVGKEVIAQEIHKRSPRKDKLFKAVNCGVFYQDLLQSELFGHEKGAFTGATSQRRGLFELADGSTLFLDEIGEMSPEVQVKFLRVLETQEFTRLGGERNVHVNVRIIAATNINLEQSVKDKEFRQDLYYRLNLFHIQIPPLRDRREDIPLFVDAFISELREKHSKRVKGIKPDALDRLQNAVWQGNIRQLRNAVEAAIIVATSDELELIDFPSDLGIGEAKLPVQITSEPGTSIQLANQNTDAISAENVAIYKTILVLIDLVSRLLKSNAIPIDDQVRIPISDDHNEWIHITESDDEADAFRKARDILLANQEGLENLTQDEVTSGLENLTQDEVTSGLENLTQDEVTSIVTSVEQQESRSEPVGYLPVLEEDKIIGRVGMKMADIEKAAIYKTLKETGENKSKAAEILGIGVRTLYRRLDEYEQEIDKAHDTVNQE